MPNWVTTKINATTEVIQALLNEECQVDFQQIAPYPGTFTWNGVYGDAETAAELVCAVPVSDHPLLADLQRHGRSRVNAVQMSDESFEQFVQMLRNKRITGYFHTMDFARDVWGTKWNACRPKHDLEAGTAEFETAWSFPEPILMKLSQRFPDTPIHVQYADEDIGSNCGELNFLGGAATARNEAGNWNSMSPEDRNRWTAFAYQVTGREPDPDDE